jgi:holliday junction DNA helicase RuvA
VIGYLKGRILDFSDNRLLLGVGPEAAVGYVVMVPHGASYANLRPGTSTELFIHTHVREDALDLYGFLSRSEKELFQTLLSVNGIGPKGAIGILSKVEPEVLIQTVLAGDKEALVRIPGIGKKTAERVVLELSDPIRKKIEAGHLTGFSGPAGAESAGRPISVVQDARDALIGLGYREQEVVNLLKKLTEGKGPARGVEELIKTALQQLS